MRKSIIGSSLLASAILAVSLSGAAMAQNKTASPATVKIGYFNLALVKATTPAGDAEALKNQAEGQLRRDIETGQKAIEKAKADKKTDEELKDMVKQVQTELAAKQQALAQIVQSATMQDTQRLVGAVANVAKKKGLDLIVDANSVYAGGKEVLDKGVDVTSDVVEAMGGKAGNKTAEASGSKTE
jgi:Skp family chaperone for outer membrane proteins